MTVQRLLHEVRHALQSPSRRPRTAVVIGRLLAAAFVICFGTGLYSHFLQDPLPWMVFPTRPIFIYQLTQGIHITAGILCFPLLLAKLYSIYPLLFEFPPVRSFPHFLERASIAIFVAASLVQITIGLINTYQWYALFPFPFRQTHYALSFVIIGSLAIHIAVKLPIIAKHWRKRDSEAAEAADAAAAATPEEAAEEAQFPERKPWDQPRGITGRLFAWIDATPAPAPGVSRRGFFAAVGASAATLVLFTAGQSFRVLDPLNILGPRKNDVGPNALPVNRTAKEAKVLETATADNWVLTVAGPTGSRALSRADLLALPQHEVQLPIACVEGWSQMASWRGPRLRDVVDLVGAHESASIRAISLEQKSSYGRTEIQPEFVRDELTLVALEVNGDTLDLDHGYPARIISPGRPGVLQTKWLSSLETI